MNVIDSHNLERDAGGKPLHTFPHPALAHDPFGLNRIMLKQYLLQRVFRGEPVSTSPEKL
ncbi:MAG: hypothetical protein AB7O60_02200 [Variibacter sp.]